MNITFLGAARTVTGSCYLVETNSAKFLVDCGMFQGGTVEEELNYQDFAFNPSEIDFMLLSHAHIDHSGRIPLLYKRGFKGTIYSTSATKDLCTYMLADSAHIQEMDAEWKNRKRKRAGLAPVEPLYTVLDAQKVIALFEGLDYDKEFSPNDNIKIRFNDAGHMLGSSIIEIWVTEDGKTSKIVFSGDLGNKNIPILRDPTKIKDADYVICESTYGSSLHETKEDKTKRLFEILIKTYERGGNTVIPSFAVGRTQEILYEIHKDRENYLKEINFLNTVPVYVDSPLATSVSEVFRKHTECFDSEAREYIEKGDYPLDFPNLKFTKSTEESKAINDIKEPIIIISASGMCDAGRIRHHLKHNLWKKENTVVFVGYQAKGTLGRRILEGEKNLKILGEDITVNADIEYIESFSGHADQAGIMDWLKSFEKKPKKIFIVHGEEEAQQALSQKINEELNIETVIPDRYETYDVSGNFVKAMEHKELNTVKIEFNNNIEEFRLRYEKIYGMLQGILKEDNELKDTKDVLDVVSNVNKNLTLLYRTLREKVAK